MALATYSDLQTTVANYLGRGDLTSQIPDFISLAELRLSRDIRTRRMLKTATTAMVVADPTIGLPTDFLAIRDVFIQGTPRTVLSYISPAIFSSNSRADESGLPVFYTMRGNEMEFAPKPDSAYVLQMLYYSKPTELSSTTATNEFLANYPDALLYASLLEAEPYLMNDPRTQTWSSLYNQAVTRINTSDEESEFSGVPLVMTVATR
jgi:hypothetical protein